MRRVIFDLDGTLSDSAEGITRSINHALVQLGGVPRPPQELLPYVGPALVPTFRTLLGTGDERTITAAVAAFRQRYMTLGFRENRLYDGIADALAELRAQGATLSIATAKREDR
jgi:phosphoglycolate phosphatase